MLSNFHTCKVGAPLLTSWTPLVLLPIKVTEQWTVKPYISTLVMIGTNFQKFWWSINVTYLFSEVEALLKVDNISLLCSTESLLQVAKPPTTIFNNS